MKWIIFLFFSQSLWSQTFTAQELLKLGEERAPHIKSQIYAVESSESMVKQSRLLANPIVTFQGGAIKSATQGGSVADLSINQPIPWLGKRAARIKSQEFLLSLSELDQEETKLSILHRIHLLVAEVAASQEVEKHYTERQHRFSLINKFLQTHIQASPKQSVDQDLIEAQIRIIERNMITLMARREALLWELEILTGSKVKAVEFSWKDDLPVPLKGHFLDAFESSPKTKRLKVMKNLSENRIEEARLEARPDILVGVNYRQENIAPVNHFYHGQVSIVMPIIDRGQHSVNAAQANLRRTEAINEVERNQFLATIHAQFATLVSAHKNTQIFTVKNIKPMDKKFEKAEVAFRKGQIDALTFLQSDTQVHENIDQVFMTRLEYLNSLSQLNIMVGKAPEL